MKSPSKKKLASGVEIPVIGFGVGTAWFAGPQGNEDSRPVSSELIESIKSALQLGYRHLDTAEVYGTEREVGIAIRESGVPREVLFVTAKVLPRIKDPMAAIKASLARLQLEYVDLYLIHAPFFSKETHGISHDEAWEQMGLIKKSGLAKAIGVSNFQVSQLQSLLLSAKVKPEVNQIEFHPYLQQKELIELCRMQGILVEAYGPLVPVKDKVEGPLETVITEISKKIRKTQGQVLLRWVIEKGFVGLTTSGKIERQAEQLEVSHAFELSAEEVAAIDRAGEQLTFRRYWPKQFAELEAKM